MKPHTSFTTPCRTFSGLLLILLMPDSSRLQRESSILAERYEQIYPNPCRWPFRIDPACKEGQTITFLKGQGWTDGIECRSPKGELEYGWRIDNFGYTHIDETLDACRSVSTTLDRDGYKFDALVRILDIPGCDILGGDVRMYAYSCSRSGGPYHLSLIYPDGDMADVLELWSDGAIHYTAEIIRREKHSVERRTVWNRAGYVERYLEITDSQFTLVEGYSGDGSIICCLGAKCTEFRRKHLPECVLR